MITIDDIRAEIRDGEGSVREFKATYHWSVKARQIDNDLRLEVLKTIAAFMNAASGGVLLIGVEDDGRLFGIQNDGYKNTDAFMLAVISDAKNAMGAGVATYLEPSTYEMDGKMICRIQCWPSAEPIFLKFGGQEDLFFVRTGPMTTKLKPSEIRGYIRRRWPTAGDNSGRITRESGDEPQPFYLTELLKALSTPSEAIRSLAIEVNRLLREGKISFTINAGPSRDLSESIREYERQLSYFRQTTHTTNRVLDGLAGRDNDEAERAKQLIVSIEDVVRSAAALSAVRDRILAGAATIDNLDQQREVDTYRAVADSASDLLVAMLYPEPKIHIFLRGELAFTPKSATNDSRDFVLQFKLVNTGPKSTNAYKVEAEIPTAFVAGTRPSPVFDLARTTSDVTFLKYPAAGDPVSVYPGKPEVVIDVAYVVTAAQMLDTNAMEKRVVFRVFQPDGGYTESSRAMGELHNCHVDLNGVIHTMPTLADIEAQFVERREIRAAQLGAAPDFEPRVAASEVRYHFACGSKPVSFERWSTQAWSRVSNY